MQPKRFIFGLLVSSASAGVVDPGPCKSNEVLSVLQQITATAFCSSFNNIKPTTSTQTVTTTQTLPRTATVLATVTDSQTATSTSTRAVVVTETQYLDASTAIAMETITDTSYSTVPLTETATTTITTTTEDVYYPRHGPLKHDDEARARKLVPYQLQEYPDAAISIGCSCYVSATCATQTSASTRTVYQTTTTTNTATISSMLATLVSTVNSASTYTLTLSSPFVTYTVTEKATVTTTISSVTTTTTTATQTVTPSGPAFAFVKAYSPHCIPTRYISYSMMTSSLGTYDGFFQLCARMCRSSPTCIDIFISLELPVTYSSGPFCFLGNGDPRQGFSDATIECGGTLGGTYGYLYSLVGVESE